jgi:NTP pyrophosphatase (non-canonical NTP hydrolase)
MEGQSIMITLKKLQAEHAEWAAHNFPGSKSYQGLLGAIEELGELAHAHLKVEQGIRGNEDHAAAKIDAVADCIIYLAHYCTLEGIDLEHAVSATWENVKQRDWRKNPDTAHVEGLKHHTKS